MGGFSPLDFFLGGEILSSLALFLELDFFLFRTDVSLAGASSSTIFLERPRPLA